MIALSTLMLAHDAAAAAHELAREAEGGASFMQAYVIPFPQMDMHFYNEKPS